MHVSNQLRKDLEGFLEDLYTRGDLSSKLKEEKLIERTAPKIEEFFDNYNSHIYNQERIQQLKNNLVKELPNYVKIDSALKKYINKRESLKVLIGGAYAVVAFSVTKNIFISLLAYMIGNSLMSKKDKSEEYSELEKKRTEKIEKMLSY